MAEYRLDPHGVRPGDEADVMQTVDGVATWAPLAVPTINTPLVTVINGSPGLVFDADGRQVYTEGSS